MSRSLGWSGSAYWRIRPLAARPEPKPWLRVERNQNGRRFRVGGVRVGPAEQHLLAGQAYDLKRRILKRDGEAADELRIAQHGGRRTLPMPESRRLDALRPALALDGAVGRDAPAPSSTMTSRLRSPSTLP